MSTFTSGNQDIDVSDFDEGAWPARGSFRAAVEQVATHARERLPDCNGRVDAAVKLVLAGDVELLPDGSAHIFSASQAGTVYHLVNGSCPCRDFPQAPHGFCKHRLGAAILRRARTVLDTPASAPEPELEPVEAVETPAGIPAQYVVRIKGKPFIRFAGLLQMGYAQGLQRLETTFISVTDTLALAQCTATFTDGRVVTDVADSSPGNVGATVRLHWPRLAATRAAARALRNALAVDMCSLEEVGE